MLAKIKTGVSILSNIVHFDDQERCICPRQDQPRPTRSKNWKDITKFISSEDIIILLGTPDGPPKCPVIPKFNQESFGN